MKKELEKKLFDKYPDIFRQKDLTISQSAIPWGAQCNNGWFSLLDTLCGWITHNMKNNSHAYPQIEFTTVKEKWGRLTIYWHPVGDTTGKEDGVQCLSGAIDFAEEVSSTICEDCGKPGKLYNVDSWYLTACPRHLKSYIAYIKKTWKKKTVKVVYCAE